MDLSQMFASKNHDLYVIDTIKAQNTVELSFLRL